MKWSHLQLQVAIHWMWQNREINHRCKNTLAIVNKNVQVNWFYYINNFILITAHNLLESCTTFDQKG